ncbi:MAG: hypothetical protein A2X49_09690 [Lentisphaerae bacterium GWF2_52_8]|nr:MAG: hypothetical protein A2X49_09690 [Lentisphaerae bacterium GWF2_52_8]
MKQLIATLEAQIKNCKGLLSVFQDERKLYQEKGEAPQRDVNEIIKRKKQIVEAFEKQHQLFRELQQCSENAASDDKGSFERRRLLIRELAGVLEQLLVIDQENEKLLRSLTCTKPTFQQSMAKQRPALQTRLPFMPNHSAASAIGTISMPPPAAKTISPAIQRPAIAAVAAKSATAAATTSQNSSQQAAPRSQLRRYTEATQLLQLTSKYA